MAGRFGLSRGTRRLNLTVLAVGKATKGPERELCARYLERAQKAGRALGIAAVAVREVADGQGPRRVDVEGGSLARQLGPGPTVALDERGEGWTSAGFASTLQEWLDRGETGVTFLIGGADGLASAVKDGADHRLSLSAMTLPHLLARALLLEQIYRAITIRLGHPYHRP